jgi:anti-sigma factor RsiW
MKNCKIIRKMLSGYIDGALTAAEAEAVSEHLEECGECREVHDSMSSIIACMNGMEKVPPPADFLGKVNARLERGSGAAERLRRIFVPRGFRLPLELAGLAAAVVLIVYISGFLGRKGVEEMAPGVSLDKGLEVRADGVEEEKAAGREEEMVADREETGAYTEKKAGRAEQTAIAQEIVVEAEAKRIEVKSGEARYADSNEEPLAQPMEDAAGAAAQKSGGEAKDVYGAAESMKVEEKKRAPSFALSVNPPSDGLDSLLAALEGTGREIEAFAVKIGGRVVPERETAVVKTSIRAAMSDRRTIRPLTVVVPADSLQIFLGEIERLGKTRPIGASIVSQEGDSATVRVELN